jgi:trigger factor
MSFTYRGLKADLARHIVTAEEVERQLVRLQQQTPRIAPVTDRPTEQGDEVVLDYAGFCDGEQFAGGTAQMQTLVLGSGQFIPGFEEQLLDKVPGEEVSVKVTFPTQYHAAELAGKEAEFKCKIHEIRIKSSYELDDTFAKEVGGCETLEQMRTKLGQSMQAYSDERGEMDLQDRLMRQAAETLEFEPSETQIQAELDEQIQNLRAQLAQQGLSLEMYCQFMSTTEDALREDARANAVASVRVQAAIEQIVSLENLEASKEEIGEAVALIARQNNMTLEQLKPYYDAQFEAAVIRSVLTSKVMKLIRDAAEITETIGK